MNQLTKMQEALAEHDTRVTQILDALLAAYAFIDASPCDPDITEKQAAAYIPYKATRDALDEAMGMTFPNEKYGSDPTAKGDEN